MVSWMIVVVVVVVVVEWARARSYLLGQAAKSVISPDNVHVSHTC